jgi:hypothetical protein
MISFPDRHEDEAVKVDEWLPQLRSHVLAGNTVKSGMEQIIYRMPELTPEALKEVNDMGWDINEPGKYFNINEKDKFYFDEDVCTPLACIIRKSKRIWKINGMLRLFYPLEMLIEMLIEAGANTEIRTECKSIYGEHFSLSMVDLCFVSDHHGVDCFIQLEKYVPLIINSETIERYINGSDLNILISKIGNDIKDVSGRKLFNEDFETIKIEKMLTSQERFESSPGYISIRGNGVNCEWLDTYFYYNDYYRWTEDMLRNHIIKEYKMVPEDGLDRTDLQDIISEKDNQEVIEWVEQHYESMNWDIDDDMRPDKTVSRSVNSRGLLHNLEREAYIISVKDYDHPPTSPWKIVEHQYRINGVLHSLENFPAVVKEELYTEKEDCICKEEFWEYGVLLKSETVPCEF